MTVLRGGGGGGGGWDRRTAGDALTSGTGRASTSGSELAEFRAEQEGAREREPMNYAVS